MPAGIPPLAAMRVESARRAILFPPQHSGEDPFIANITLNRRKLPCSLMTTRFQKFNI